MSNIFNIVDMILVVENPAGVNWRKNSEMSTEKLFIEKQSFVNS